MIIVRITSGLGNQMFQYNLYRFLKTRYKDVPVKADLTWFYANDDHHGYELKRVFDHEGSDFAIEEATPSEIFKITGYIPNCSKKHGAAFEKFRRFPNRLLKNNLTKSRRKNVIDAMSESVSFDRFEKLDTSKDHYIIGFFIEEAFWKERIPVLKRELRFDDKYSRENHELALRILDKDFDSVSIHVRRGDYLTVYAGQFKPLGRTYYEAAVNEIKKYADNPHFYIFSDDPLWVSEEFSWLNEKTIVDINHGNDSFRDMQLMSLCKHNIIANSTFSTWAAILNDNDGHITIYPKDYLRDEDSEIKTVKGWIRL